MRHSYTDASLSKRFRYWLIKIIAGKAGVVMNCQIGVVTATGHIAKIEDFTKGIYCNNVDFCAPTGGMIALKGRP